MSVMAKLGFDPGRLAFAFRTAVGACIALGLAWMLGLDHPQWAAMSVWAAAQPLRGQLLEKSFFRFAGTVSGTAAGIVLVLAGQIHPLLLVAGLALWVAACCQSARNFDPLSAPNNAPAWSARVAGPMRCSLHTAQPDRASGVSVIPAS